MTADPARLAAAEAVHLALLQRWRDAMDLVGPGPLEPHFVDCRGAVSGLGAEGDWADLGSGAGFPGIALAALYPEARVLLVESRQKRAAFLQRVVLEAGLRNATVHHGRTEDLAPASLDGLISRAYKPPRQLLGDADRLLRPGGRAALLLGSQADVELPLGWVERARDRYVVGDGARLRLILAREAGAAPLSG
jgi:16S rRNA (guanine(527)-N(7))-methyltransferase RsmG